MDILERILLLLVYTICATRGEYYPFNSTLNTEINIAKCRSRCVQTHVVKQPTLHQECEHIKINSSDNLNSNVECSKCWTTCQKLANGTSQTWSDICENGNNIKCGDGCQTACSTLKNKSKHSNRHLTKSLGRNRMKTRRNDDREENRVPQRYHRKPQKIRSRQNKQRRRQRTRYKDIRLDVPTVLENCIGMSWTDPTKNINFVTPSRKRNKGRMYQARQDHLHALIYILFARNNLNKWFELAQTTHFSYIFQFPKSALETLNEIRLLAVSDHGIIDQTSLNVTTLNCNAEESPVTQSLTSKFTETNQRFRRTFKNEESNYLMEYIRAPPDELFLPLVIGCLILALACIFMLVLLAVRSKFKIRTTSINHLDTNISENSYPSTLNNRRCANLEDSISNKSYSVFTIYEQGWIQTYPSNDVNSTYFTKHTQL